MSMKWIVKDPDHQEQAQRFYTAIVAEDLVRPAEGASDDSVAQRLYDTARSGSVSQRRAPAEGGVDARLEVTVHPGRIRPSSREGSCRPSPGRAPRHCGLRSPCSHACHMGQQVPVPATRRCPYTGTLR